MEETKTDLRVIKTRKLIMDAFIELSRKKEFKDITIKDITTEAMINRATFYYHFLDKYDLREKVLSEVLQVNLERKSDKFDEFSEDSIINIFIAITDFQLSLSNRCHRGYEDTIARIIREHLEDIFYQMLLKANGIEEDLALKRISVILSWALYGLSVEWRRIQGVSPEEFVRPVIPYLLNEVKINSD